MVRDNGGLFNFNSLDIAKNNGGATEIVVEGYVGNVLQATDTYMTTAANFDFINVISSNLSGLAIDELRIELDAGLSPAPIETIDNLELNIIPEPATTTLSLLALGGFAMRRRRSA